MALRKAILGSRRSSSSPLSARQTGLSQISSVDGSLGIRPTLPLHCRGRLMILSAIAEKLKRRSKDDFKGRHFQASLILQAVSWYLRYSLSYRDIEELFRERS